MKIKLSVRVGVRIWLIDEAAGKFWVIALAKIIVFYFIIKFFVFLIRGAGGVVPDVGQEKCQYHSKDDTTNNSYFYE